MERAKLLVGIVIAVCLVKLAFGDVLVGEARAGDGLVDCEAFPAAAPGGLGVKQLTNSAQEWVMPIRQWLFAHPGNTAFVAELYSGSVTVICVRS